ARPGEHFERARPHAARAAGDEGDLAGEVVANHCDGQPYGTYGTHGSYRSYETSPPLLIGVRLLPEVLAAQVEFRAGDDRAVAVDFNLARQPHLVFVADVGERRERV